MIVATCFIGCIIFSQKSLGKTFKVTREGRIQAIQEESQQFLNPHEVVPPEFNEQQRLLRISLQICGTIVESIPMARYAPKCKKTVQALLCRNLNIKSVTLPNATSSRCIRLQDNLVTGFHFSVSEIFEPGCYRVPFGIMLELYTIYSSPIFQISFPSIHQILGLDEFKVGVG